MDGGAWWAAVHGVAKSRTPLSDFTFTFHFHALEKEMATHSSVLAWRIPGTGEPGGLPSMGSHEATSQHQHQWVLDLFFKICIGTEQVGSAVYWRKRDKELWSWVHLLYWPETDNQIFLQRRYVSSGSAGNCNLRSATMVSQVQVPTQQGKEPAFIEGGKGGYSTVWLGGS